MSSTSTANALRESLNKMNNELARIIFEIPVEEYETRYIGTHIISNLPDYDWRSPTAEQNNTLLGIKREFEEWIELVQSIFRDAPDNVTCKIEETEKRYRMWLELESNFSITPNPDSNKAKFLQDASEFLPLLDILDASADASVIVIPDTNSIVDHPDPKDYKSVADSDKFTFLLLPTVLGELDKIKNLHRNSDFRDKAKQVISRIKGWRKQGPLRDGVTVERTITVKAISNEPDMGNTLSWLDPEIADDRIIASILEIQAKYPGEKIIFVTGDINLMNKADTARIHIAEIQ